MQKKATGIYFAKVKLAQYLQRKNHFRLSKFVADSIK